MRLEDLLRPYTLASASTPASCTTESSARSAQSPSASAIDPATTIATAIAFRRSGRTNRSARIPITIRTPRSNVTLPCHTSIPFVGTAFSTLFPRLIAAQFADRAERDQRSADDGEQEAP